MLRNPSLVVSMAIPWSHADVFCVFMFSAHTQSLTGAQLEARRMRRSPEILFVVEHSNDEEIL